MTDLEFSEIAALMRHEAPRPMRRKTRWPIRTTPPKCDACQKQLAPGVDHSICKEPT